jgi:formiminotetrahydrofolate cyclodeaminase
MGVGLGLKVIGISGPDGGADPVRQRLEQLLQRLLPEFTVDCTAFAGLFDALRLPRNEAGREVRFRDAWREATAAPVAVALHARLAESLLTECVAQVKSSVRADLHAALDLVRSGGRIAERNARENAERLDPGTANHLLAALDRGQGA